MRLGGIWYLVFVIIAATYSAQPQVSTTPSLIVPITTVVMVPLSFPFPMWFPILSVPPIPVPIPIPIYVPVALSLSLSPWLGLG